MGAPGPGGPPDGTGAFRFRRRPSAREAEEDWRDEDAPRRDDGNGDPDQPKQKTFTHFDSPYLVCPNETSLAENGGTAGGHTP